MKRKEEIHKESYHKYAWSPAYMLAFEEGAEWADKTILKPANGDNLPEIDREVVALVEENGYYKAVFAHRPKHNGDAYCFGKGGWNQPNVRWWLDLELPKMKE